MKLVIAEKPSVAKTYAAVLGVKARKDGYFEGERYLISWCIGHLAGLADAGMYDPKYRDWKQENLPILPESWLTVPDLEKKKQLKSIIIPMRRFTVS